MDASSEEKSSPKDSELEVTLKPPFPTQELTALQSAVLGFSLAYHARGERPGAIAKVEGSLAKALFVYGSLQTFVNAPNDVFAAECVCFAATLGAFLLTNLRPETYEKWHALGLHVVPGVWGAIVACRHESLLTALPAGLTYI